jgi:hypothetical protein
MMFKLQLSLLISLSVIVVAGAAAGLAYFAYPNSAAEQEAASRHGRDFKLACEVASRSVVTTA